MSKLPTYLRDGKYVNRPPRQLHKCAHPKCEKEIPMNMFACSGHWSELPLVVKLEVQEQYDKAKKVGKFDVDYFNAVRKAKGFWKDVPQK